MQTPNAKISLHKRHMMESIQQALGHFPWHSLHNCWEFFYRTGTVKKTPNMKKALGGDANTARWL